MPLMVPAALGWASEHVVGGERRPWGGLLVGFGMCAYGAACLSTALIEILLASQHLPPRPDDLGGVSGGAHLHRE